MCSLTDPARAFVGREHLWQTDSTVWHSHTKPADAAGTSKVGRPATTTVLMSHKVGGKRTAPGLLSYVELRLSTWQRAAR